MEADLVLIHPPAYFEFRQQPSLTGLLSDLVPPTSVFEMYPLGFTSIGHYLEGYGFKVRIVNLAYRMLTNPRLDVDKFLRKLRARVFGVDLHWLVHAPGALELAHRLKKMHPGSAVILGGVSASYYHEEAIGYPGVDYVVRGDSTEEPLRQLLLALKGSGRLEDVPNLTWKNQGRVMVNPLTHVPDQLDYVEMPGYRYMVRAVARSFGLRDAVPYLGWLQNPMTAVLTSRGCARGCYYCGGSAPAYGKICGRKRPAYRSPAQLVKDMKFLSRLTRAPIYILHDIRQPGQAYAGELLALLAEARLRNQVIFELFDPASPEFMGRLAGATRNFGLELALESSDTKLRRQNGKFACSNQEVEATVAAGLEAGALTVHLYFMIGLSGQTRETVLADAEFCRRLFERHATRRLSAFVSPLAPFLDPGSPAFEEPGRYGYRVLWRSLEEHRRAVLEPTWKQTLNYETDMLTRGDIVDLTYEAARTFADLKLEAGLMDEKAHAGLVDGIERSRQIIARCDLALDLPDPERGRMLQEVRRAIRAQPGPLLRGPGELVWPVPGLLRGAAGLVWAALAGAAWRY
ncbi:MAG: TIGR04190 family B12-binding domain/radical SAM domain protein [Bacillota bacterium]